MSKSYDIPVVIIGVSGGVASVEQLPPGIKVIIRDYDNAEEMGLDEPEDDVYYTEKAE